MSKILFPAIDLKDGECVRLKLGDMNEATVYNEDPGAQAKVFEDQGFKWLHVVDLNGAFEGETVNGKAVEAILANTKNPVQLGGGIRTLDHIAHWLDKGIARVILGTIAVRDPDLVKQACKKFPGKIAVGIDAKGGKVAVEGWAEASELGVIELAQKFEGAGVSAIIYTDIDRDGILTGINWPSTIELAQAVSIPVIASGGLASMQDIARLTESDCAKLEGAITGRALYDGRIDSFEALQLIDGNRWTVQLEDGKVQYCNMNTSRRNLVKYVLQRVLAQSEEFDTTPDVLFSLQRVIDAFNQSTVITVKKDDLKSSLEQLHKVIYLLGEFELSTITGLNLEEFMSAGLLLFGGFNEGTYMGSLWTESISFDT